MSHALNFDQLGLRDNFIHDAVITQSDAVGMFRPGQLFDTLRERVFCQGLNRFDNPIHCAGWQSAQILLGGFFPLNVKGHCASHSV